MKNPTTFFVALFVVGVIGSIGLLWWINGSPDLAPPSQPPAVANFDDCVAAGNPIMESYPAQCNHAGQTYTQNIGNVLEKTDLIFLDSVTPNQIVTSPLVVTGQARGSWFFEASFPIQLTDASGNVIGSAVAQTSADWMTENFVPFRATIQFDQPSTPTGTLILRRDNPSGLPEQEDMLQLPVKFSGSAE